MKGWSWKKVMIVALAAGLLGPGCKAEPAGAHPDPGEALEELLAQTPEVVVARVNGHALGLDEFMAYWAEHRDLDAGEALERLVARQALVAHARHDGDATRHGLGGAELAFARKQAMVRVLLEELVEGQITAESLTEEEILAVTRDLEERAGRPAGARASHILVQVPREIPVEGGRNRRLSGEERERLYGEGRPWIDEILVTLTAAADGHEKPDVDGLYGAQRAFMERVAAPLTVIVNAHLSFPTDAPRPNETLPTGWLRVVPAFAEATAELGRKENLPALSAPVRSEFGWHIILLEELYEPMVPEPEALKALAIQEALRIKRASRVEELLTTWVEESTIFLYPEVIARQGKLYRE